MNHSFSGYTNGDEDKSGGGKSALTFLSLPSFLSVTTTTKAAEEAIILPPSLAIPETHAPSPAISIKTEEKSVSKTDYEATTEKKRNSHEAAAGDNKNAGTSLLGASAKDTTTASTSSSVKPRTIPFANGDISDGKNESQQQSTEGVEGQMELEQFYGNLLSDCDPSMTEPESPEAPPFTQEENYLDKDGFPVHVIRPKTSTKATSSSKTNSNHLPVPSVVNNDALMGINDMSGISYNDEAIQIGKNAYLTKHTGQGQMILYQVISSKDAEDLILKKGTFDTEAPLLSYSESSEGMEGGVKPTKSSTEAASLTCKVKAAMCCSGFMVLLIGLFVGVAVTAFNINKVGITSQSAANATAVDTRDDIQETTSAVSFRPTAPPTMIQMETTNVPSMQPSVSAPVSLYDALDLPDYTWEAIRNDDLSPQAKSFKILQEEPTLATYSQQRKLQRFVLRVLYFSTSGENWTQNDSWLSPTTHECKFWSNTCGEEDDLHRIVIRDNAMNGTLPLELGLLTTLVDLDLSHNNLLGSLPSFLGSMSNLQTLNLTSNQLSSTLPSEIALLTQLRHLDLDSCLFDEAIPREIASLTNLETISLSNNRFSGWLPSELGKLSRLQKLAMQRNRFSGLLPSELGHLTRMRELLLFENRFRSAMPSEFGNLERLEKLSLGWNSLSGFIFTEIGRLQRLVELDIVSNQIDGSIPTEIGGLERLEHLWLFSNNIEGTIPTEVGQLNRLNQMLLFWNWLTGP